MTSSFAHSNGFHGISVQGGAGVHVTGNTATGNLTPGIRRAAGIDVSSASLNALVERNISHDNDDSGLEIYTGSTGAVVRRNISYDNGDHGIDISASANATVVSNTSVSNSAAGLNVEGGSTATTLRNNISVDDAVGTDRSKGDIRVDSASVAGTSIDHDLTFQTNGATPLFEWDAVVYPSLAGLRAATNQEAHGLAADPQFVDRDDRDLQLGPVSPALDAADSSTPGMGREPTRPVRLRWTSPTSPTPAWEPSRTPTSARWSARRCRCTRPDRPPGSTSPTAPSASVGPIERTPRPRPVRLCR